MVVAVLILLAAVAAAAPVNSLPPFKGVLVTAQYRCDDFLCPDWELDVARVDPAWREHITTKLAMLVPKSPIAAMSFPVYTAYHEATRTFYTVGLPELNGGTVWAVTIDGSVNTSTILYSTRFQYPDQLGPIIRIHVSSNNTLYAVFKQGTLVSVDPKTGTLSTVGKVVPSNYTDAQISQASVLDPSTDNLYTFFLSGDGASIATLNIKTGLVTAAAVNLKRVRWNVEDLFTALWLPKTSEVVLFLAGESTGFDQIATVNAATGAGTFLFGNLADNQLFFMCDQSTKSCDVLQTACYDSIENRIYFQATQIQSQDDVGTTVLMYIDLNGKVPYIDTGLNPFTFGYLGFQFASVQA